MSTIVTPKPVSDVAPAAGLREVRVYRHSFLMYWWPIWLVGFLLALLTWMEGVPVTFSGNAALIPEKAAALTGAAETASRDPRTVTVHIHPSQNLGVIFTFTFLLVIVMTNIEVRGMASLAVIIAAIALVLLFAYLDWWGYILNALGKLAIYMNLGFYLFTATAMCVIWIISTFFVDHFEYWSFQPGQMIHYRWLGGGAQTFDTRGMSVSKERSDLFRHWILGLGSGDLRVAATGAKIGDFTIANVPFVGSKLAAIEKLVALKPGDVERNVFTAGEPG
jgi:hypothetical protein